MKAKIRSRDAAKVADENGNTHDIVTKRTRKKKHTITVRAFAHTRTRTSRNASAVSDSLHTVRASTASAPPMRSYANTNCCASASNRCAFSACTMTPTCARSVAGGNRSAVANAVGAAVAATEVEVAEAEVEAAADVPGLVVGGAMDAAEKENSRAACSRSSTARSAAMATAWRYGNEAGNCGADA